MFLVLVYKYITPINNKDDLSSDLLAGGATNNLASAGSGLSGITSGINSAGTNMNIIDNRPPPPPHSSVLHMSGKFFRHTKFTNSNIENLISSFQFL